MNTWSYRPPENGLKRGPKPDETLDKVVKTITINLTQGEFEAFEGFRKSVPCPPTRSAFGRYLLTRFMELYRVRGAAGRTVLRFGTAD